MDTPDVLLHFHHNLVCDSIPAKVKNALLRVWHADALRSDHNVFYTRIPGAERHLVETAFIHGQQVGHADPATYRGENLLLTDLQTKFRQDQNSRTGTTLTPLDFKDFIPAADNPLSKASDEKAVGLEPGVVSGCLKASQRQSKQHATTEQSHREAVERRVASHPQ